MTFSQAACRSESIRRRSERCLTTSAAFLRDWSRGIAGLVPARIRSILLSNPEMGLRDCGLGCGNDVGSGALGTGVVGAETGDGGATWIVVPRLTAKSPRITARPFLKCRMPMPCRQRRVAFFELVEIGTSEPAWVFSDVRTDSSTTSVSRTRMMGSAVQFSPSERGENSQSIETRLCLCSSTDSACSTSTTSSPAPRKSTCPRSRSAPELVIIWV